MARIIPDVVNGQKLRTLSAAHTARDAGELMLEADISAVLVVDADDALVGLVTERDLARAVVAAGRDPGTTPLADVMSRSPDTIEPGASPLEALELMRHKRFRHLPVVDGERLIGIVSMRDLRHGIARGYKAEPVRERWWKRLTG